MYFANEGRHYSQLVLLFVPAAEMKKINPDVPIILFSGTVPERVNGVDVHVNGVRVNKGEPTATFLGIVREVDEVSFITSSE